MKASKEFLISIFLLCISQSGILLAKDKADLGLEPFFANEQIDDACQLCMDRINKINMVLPVVEGSEKKELLKEKEKFEKIIFMIKGSGEHFKTLNEEMEERLNLSQEQINGLKTAGIVAAIIGGSLIAACTITVIVALAGVSNLKKVTKAMNDKYDKKINSMMQDKMGEFHNKNLEETEET